MLPSAFLCQPLRLTEVTYFHAILNPSSSKHATTPSSMLVLIYWAITWWLKAMEHNVIFGKGRTKFSGWCISICRFYGLRRDGYHLILILASWSEMHHDGWWVWWIVNGCFVWPWLRLSAGITSVTTTFVTFSPAMTVAARVHYRRR